MSRAKTSYRRIASGLFGILIKTVCKKFRHAFMELFMLVC